MSFMIAAALLCFIVPAIALAAFGFLSRRNYKRTVGVVVGQDVANGDTQQLVAPIVEFATPDGRTITFTEKVHSSESILEEIGHAAAAFLFKRDPNKVTVLYDPNNPQTARVSSVGNLYMLPVVLFAFGLLLMLLTIPGFEAVLRRLTAVLEKIPF